MLWQGHHLRRQGLEVDNLVLTLKAAGGAAFSQLKAFSQQAAFSQEKAQTDTEARSAFSQQAAISQEEAQPDTEARSARPTTGAKRQTWQSRSWSSRRRLPLGVAST